jgi:hypothetical protein
MEQPKPPTVDGFRRFWGSRGFRVHRSDRKSKDGARIQLAPGTQCLGEGREGFRVAMGSDAAVVG